MASLAEVVDVVIGVDTHKHTHTGAVVATPSGAVLDHDTVGTDPDGYDQLVALADAHSGLLAWAIESTGAGQCTCPVLCRIWLYRIDQVGAGTAGATARPAGGLGGRPRPNGISARTHGGERRLASPPLQMGALLASGLQCSPRLGWFVYGEGGAHALDTRHLDPIITRLVVSARRGPDLKCLENCGVGW
jgi:hypothetical protein